MIQVKVEGVRGWGHMIGVITLVRVAVDMMSWTFFSAFLSSEWSPGNSSVFLFTTLRRIPLSHGEGMSSRNNVM